MVFMLKNRTLHDRAGIRVLSSRADMISLKSERYHENSKIKFLSPILYMSTRKLENEYSSKTEFHALAYQRHLCPVHTYPEIFVSANFFMRIQKYLRPHVAYTNRIRPSTRIRFVSGHLKGLVNRT